MWMRRAGRQGIAGGATAIAAACGGGGDDGPVGNTGSIQVALSATSLSVQQGSGGSVTATLTRGGGFSGAVSLAIAGLPAGVTTTITPAQLSGSTTTATIDVAVAATVAVGTYTATITAAAQGVGQATVTFDVAVSAPPNYTLTLTSATLTIPAGSNGNATVNINRTNFTAGVTLALQNAPAGITGTFNPSPSTTNASQLAVNVAANVAPGNYALTIQGSATGLSNRTVALQLTVTPAPSGGNNVEYQFCDASAVPVFFAFQDGTNAWQAVAPVASGTVTKFGFNITQGRGGVLIVSQTAASTVADVLRLGRIENARRYGNARARMRGFKRRGAAVQSLTSSLRRSFADVYETTVIYATAAELAQDGIASCAQTAPTKTITGNAAGVPAGSYGFVSFGNTTEIFEGGASTTPLSFDVPNGPRDLAGARLATPGTAPNRLILFRNLNIPNLGSLPSPIDFNGPASLSPATANVTISGGSGDDLETFVDLVTANTEVGIYSDLAPSTSATRPWAGLNSIDMLSSDLHTLIVFASAPNDDFRVTVKYVGPVANQTIALGPPMTTTTASPVAAGAYPRYRFQGTLPPEYSKLAAIFVAPTTAGNSHTILATSAYLTAAGSALAYDLTMPDVAGLPGFPIASRLAAGPNDVAADGSGFTGQGIFEPRPSLGGEYKAAVRITSITVP